MYDRLIRWAFERFYREFAWTYDTVAALVSAGQWRAWTLTALPYLYGSILELGCGTGNLQRALAERSGQPGVVGFDASAQMIALARLKIERGGGRALMVRGDARALPFPPASFDTLVATFPSEYIAARATLDEAQRVLRPGGRVVIVLGARLAGAGLYQRLVDLAYRLTLQRTPRDAPAQPLRAALVGASDGSTPPLDPFLRQLIQGLAVAGFKLQDQWIDAPGSQVYLIVGSRA
jgi:SAM-dependent methyltransferase